MPNDQIKWILETVRDSNVQLLKMSGITAGHAMALKILGAAIVAIATAGGGFLALLAMEVFDK